MLPRPTKTLRLLGKDLAVAASSFALDLLLFAVLYHVSAAVVFSTLVARCISALLNFVGNRQLVFPGPHRYALSRQLGAYVLLAIALALASAFAVQLLVTHWQTPAVATKLVVDLLLYGFSFTVRRFGLFRAESENVQQGQS